MIGRRSPGRISLALGVLATVSMISVSAEPPYFPALASKDSWVYLTERTAPGGSPDRSSGGVEIAGTNKDGDFLLGLYQAQLAPNQRITDIAMVFDSDVCVLDPYLKAKNQLIARIVAAYWYARDVRGLVRIESQAESADGVRKFSVSLEAFPAP